MKILTAVVEVLITSILAVDNPVTSLVERNALVSVSTDKVVSSAVFLGIICTVCKRLNNEKIKYKQHHNQVTQD
jgi:hypothetical protein